MVTRRRLTLPCTIINPPTPPVDADGTPLTDDMGDPLPALPSEKHTVCDLQQNSAKEQRDGGVVDVQTWSLVMAPGEPLTSASQLRTEVGLYTIDGGPWPARHPRTGRVEHIEAVTKLVQ